MWECAEQRTIGKGRSKCKSQIGRKKKKEPNYIILYCKEEIRSPIELNHYELESLCIMIGTIEERERETTLKGEGFSFAVSQFLSIFIVWIFKKNKKN